MALDHPTSHDHICRVACSEGVGLSSARDDDAFKFRVLTLRQLKDARFFFHNGSFTSVKNVVRYFNAGLPQDAQAGAASTLTTRFTNPRGPGSPRGLGLSDDQVDDLTDFIKNGLYDPAFVRFDPNSTTDTFQLNARDLTYSVYRPDLLALGAIDGRMPSRLPQSNNDALSRRDAGLGVPGRDRCPFAVPYDSERTRCGQRPVSGGGIATRGRKVVLRNVKG